MRTENLWLIVGLALIGLGTVWNWFRSKGKRAVTSVTRTTGSLARALLAGAVIVAGQWAVIASNPGPAVVLLVLAVPAVFAGAGLARLLPITETVSSTRKGHQR
jgi:hypothetical protein